MTHLPRSIVRTAMPSAVRRLNGRPAVALAALALLTLAPGASASATASATAAPAPSPTVPPTPFPVPPPFQAIVTISASGGITVALREVADDKLQLLVGQGTALQPAAGVPPLDGNRSRIPRVHAGTDADGHVVVVYPRCEGLSSNAGSFRYQRCDLRRYDVATGNDRPISGLDRPGRSEYEGVMDRGALLYAAAHARGGRSRHTGLWYRSAAGAERRIARNPGRQLALSGTRVAQVLTDGSKDAGEEPCDNSTIVVRSTTRPGTGQVLGRECLYPSWTETPSDAWTTPAFLGNLLIWARDAGSGPSLLRYDLRTRKLEEARAGRVYGFAPTTADAGLALVLTADTTGSQDEPGANEVRPIDGLRWKPRTKSLLKENHYVDADPLA